MNCKKARSLISNYINDNLDYMQTEELLRHIEACPQCMEELEIYYMVKKSLYDDNTSNFNLNASIKKYMHDSFSMISKMKLMNALYCICNTLVVLSGILCVLIQLKIWIIGGY